MEGTDPRDDERRAEAEGDRRTGKEVTAWRDEAMFAAEPVEGSGARVHLINATPDPLGTLAAVNAIYEGKVIRGRTRVTDDMRRYAWEQVSADHLKAPLEFINLHFLVDGVTRAFTHQAVRQRTAVYAQESMRFAVKESMAEEIDLPPTIRPGSIEAGVWQETLDAMQNGYSYLVANGIPAEDARGLAPHATRTRYHYGVNLRNLIAYSHDRLCTQAQFEWRMVLAGMLQAMKDYSHLGGIGEDYDGWQWDLIAESEEFRPVCYSQGKCPWGADLARPCSIRDKVEDGKWDEIDIREWLLDPNAAR